MPTSRLIRKIASIGACYVFLWGLSAGIFLAFSKLHGNLLLQDLDFSGTGQSFTSYLLAVLMSLRQQLHNTWLFLTAFIALGASSLVWIMAEKWQRNTKWKAAEIWWVVWLEILLSATAVFYGLGTNGVIAKKFSKSATMTDLLGLGLFLAVPALVWSRMHRHAAETADEDDGPRHSSTLLGLMDEKLPPLANDLDAAPLAIEAHEPLQIDAKPAAHALLPSTKTAHPALESLPLPVYANEAKPMDMEKNADPQMEPLPETVTEKAELQNLAQQGLERQNLDLPHNSVPVAGFREQLSALNAGWQRIEETGKQVEEWFHWQQQRVVAHLERQPAASANDAAPTFSHDFLEQKLQQVDSEWAAIFQTVRGMHDWLESSQARKELTEGASKG